MWKLATLAAIVLAGLVVIWGGTSLASREGGGPASGVVYSVDIGVAPGGDPDGHEQFIEMPPKLDLKAVVDGIDISVTSPESSAWVTVEGTIKGGEFFATGMGTVATVPDVEVSFQGTLTAEGLVGQYTMGTDGDLPNDDGTGESIVYDVQPKVPTPTPTATPPEKLYSITVLKRNDETKETLPGWDMNLYAGAGCSGDPIQTSTTGADGTIEFTGLLPASYSVEEKPQAGWNNVTPLCQDTVLPGAAGGSVAGLPTCPIDPDLPFPDAGCDEFNSAATVQVVFTNPPIDPLECDLSGPTQITRSAVVSGPPDSIDTEIVAMELTGTCQPGNIAVTVTESLSQASTGQIEEQKDNDPGTLEFDADSFFDVFFEIDTPLGLLHNHDPLTVRCKISEIPPFGCLYEPDVGVIPLLDIDGKEVGTLLHAAHIPLDPNKKLLIFSNERKPTPTITPTATPTEGPSPTPTSTPTPCFVDGALCPPTPTATPPATPIITPTPTPAKEAGDVNNDGRTNSIDAALILQLDAGLISSLLNRDVADVSGDGATNSIDAALILQLDAGLIDMLPAG